MDRGRTQGARVIEFPAWRTRRPERAEPAIDHHRDPSLLDRAIDAVEAVLAALTRRRGGRREVARPDGSAAAVWLLTAVGTRGPRDAALPRAGATSLRIEGVARVFVISPRGFLVYARRGDRLVPLQIYRSGGSIEVAPDVPEGKPMWIDGEACAGAFCDSDWYAWAVVHVHDAAELGGGERPGRNPARLRPLE